MAGADRQGRDGRLHQPASDEDGRRLRFVGDHDGWQPVRVAAGAVRAAWTTLRSSARARCAGRASACARWPSGCACRSRRWTGRSEEQRDGGFTQADAPPSHRLIEEAAKDIDACAAGASGPCKRFHLPQVLETRHRLGAQHKGIEPPSTGRAVLETTHTARAGDQSRPP